MPKTIRQWIIFLTGWLFVGVGGVGVILPGLPHTPFFLIALLCFAESSPRMHTWLLNAPVIGPPLKQWRENRSIPRSAKIQAILMMGIGFAIVMYIVQNPLLIGFVACCMLLVTAFILSRPS